VWVSMQNGTLQRVSLNTGLHPWRNQFVIGPLAWSLNASAFKAIPITERFTLRLNTDFFNVLNRPGYGNPGSNGIISLRSSANAARVLQATLRLTW